MEDLYSNIYEKTYTDWNAFSEDLPAENNKLIFMHVNIRSMIKNFAHLEYTIKNSSNTIHVIALTEANITEQTKNLFLLPEYTMHSELRQNRKGGGVIVYIHKSINFTRCLTKTLSFECLFGVIETRYNFHISLCAVYRPPDLNKAVFISELSRVISKSQPKSSLVLLGDMNIDLKCNLPIVAQYLDSLCELGLERGISQYTRVESKGDIITKSCIDHIFVRAVDCSEVHTAVISSALADHYITGSALVDRSHINNAPKYKCINRLDNDKVKEKLSKIDWSMALQFDNPNDILNFILYSFNDIYDSCRIKVKIKLGKRQTCEWKSDRIVYMCKKRDELYKIWQRDESNMANRLLYNKYRNKTNKHINIVQNNYIMKKVSENFRNPKKMWEIINTLCGKICNSIDDIITKHFKKDLNSITNTFAYDFRENVKKICTYCAVPLTHSNTYNSSTSVSMRLKKATKDVIYSIIKHLNDKKSPGIDQIRAKDLKLINTEITPVITHLINACIATSSYPDQLKIGIVRPIYKKGSHTDTNNYRPITILSCIDKIVERYLGNEIEKFLSSNSIINNKQYGFQKNRNTSQLLSKFCNEVNKHLNNRVHVLVAFIDFSKAFDTLNYNTLYSKLQDNGIRGPLLQWFKNYHTSRSTAVCINGVLSDKIPTEEGTAQGSILGPTEYLLYVNNMCSIFPEGSVYQFADDTCIITSHKELNEAQFSMQRNFDILCKWAHDVGLVINAGKTKIMHIHSPYLKSTWKPTITAHEHKCLHSKHQTSSSRLLCNCETLEEVNKHTYLGLIIDNRFNWHPHIEHVCNKLRAINSKLSILKFKLPYKILRMLYLSLADSVISYGLSTYGRSYKTYLENIHKLQLSILKTITPKNINKQYKDDYTNLFLHCKVINVFDKIKMAIITEEYNNINTLAKTSRPCHLRALSYLPTFRLPGYTNEYGRRTWEYMLPNVLNNLPSKLQKDICENSINIKTCKKVLKKHYLSI